MTTPTRRIAVPANDFMDALVSKVQQKLSHKNLTYGQALAWIVDDFRWCDPDKPAFGHMSPAMRDYVANVFQELA